MFGTPFYNEGLRKIIISFGQLFNNIVIENKSSDGAILKRIKVPLAYAPKEKFLVRLDEQANLEDRSMAITLPRIGFEISNWLHHISRSLGFFLYESKYSNPPNISGAASLIVPQEKQKKARISKPLLSVWLGHMKKFDLGSLLASATISSDASHFWQTISITDASLFLDYS